MILLAVYGVIPLAGLVWLIDALTGSGAVRHWLPASPTGWPWYGLIFGMPHICASLVGLLDVQVVRHHRRELALSLVVAMLSAWAMMFVLPSPWGVRLLIVWTMFHVMGQQTGLALATSNAGLVDNGIGRLWRFLLACAAASFALAIGGEAMHASLVREPALWVQASGLIMLASLPAALWLHRRTQFAGGDSRMILATQALCFASWLMVAQGYPLLAVLLPRMVHDATAFYFYAQYAGSPVARGNPLLRWLNTVRGWRRWVMLPLGVALALLLSLLPPVCALAATILHYCVERYFWRRGAPMRSALAFS
jgi:hypothetical protein